MKKIIIYSFTLICAVAIGLGVYSGQSATKNSDLVSQNIEALAMGHTNALDCHSGKIPIPCGRASFDGEGGWSGVYCPFCCDYWGIMVGVGYCCG